MSQIDGNANNRQRLFPGVELKMALTQSLSLLGDNLTEAFLDELRKKGIDLDSATSLYSVAQLEERFHELFGEDAGNLIMEHVKEYLHLH